MKMKDILALGLFKVNARFFAEENSTEEEGSSSGKDVAISESFDEKLDEEGYEEGEEKSADEDSEDEEGEESEDAEEKSSDEDKKEEDSDEIEVDQALIDRAEEVGMSVEDMEAFSTVKDLEKAVSFLESKQKVGAEEKSTEGEEKEETEEDAEFDCGLSKEVYEPEMVDAINKMGKELKAEIKALKAENAEYKQQIEQEKVKEFDNWFDGQFNSLENMEDVFGKGSAKEIVKNPEIFKNRATVFTEMQAISVGYKHTGQEVPPNEELFQMALRNKFNKNIKQASVKKTSIKLKKRADQSLGRSSNKGSATTGEEKALAANKDFDAKLDAES